MINLRKTLINIELQWVTLALLSNGCFNIVFGVNGQVFFQRFKQMWVNKLFFSMSKPSERSCTFWKSFFSRFKNVFFKLIERIRINLFRMCVNNVLERAPIPSIKNCFRKLKVFNKCLRFHIQIVYVFYR